MAMNIVRELEQIASRRKQLIFAGQRLIQELNRILPALGYQVVPARQAPVAQVEMNRPAVTPLERPKRLRCSECSRTFGQPMNLGRHMAATHGKRTQGERARGRGKRKAA